MSCTGLQRNVLLTTFQHNTVVLFFTCGLQVWTNEARFSAAAVLGPCGTLISLAALVSAPSRRIKKAQLRCLHVWKLAHM